MNLLAKNLKKIENTDEASNEIVNNKISNVSWGKRNMKNFDQL